MNIQKIHNQIIDPVDLVISKAQELLKLSPEWDGEEGTQTIDRETLKRATSILRGLADIMWSENSQRIIPPQIGPCQDGSIDLYWNTSTFTLLINVPSIDKGLPDYFGDKSDGVSIKGSIKPDHSLVFLAKWIRGA
jgi:hypothetical protein